MKNDVINKNNSLPNLNSLMLNNKELIKSTKLSSNYAQTLTKTSTLSNILNKNPTTSSLKTLNYRYF